MLRALQWPLVATWAVLGVLGGAALSSLGSRWLFLLVPVVLLAAWLLWHDCAGRESAAVLTGVSSFPLLVSIRAQRTACLFVTTCEPVNVWPWTIGGLLLIVAGSVVLLAPVVRGQRTSAATTN